MNYQNGTAYLSQFRPGPHQNRQDFSNISGLALSIEEEGLINPPLVTRKGQEYFLLAGERRWRALCVNGLVAKDVMTLEAAVNVASGGPEARPVLVDLAVKYLGDVPTEIRISQKDQNSKVLSVIENGQRENLNPIEEGQDYLTLIEDGHTPAEVAELVNKAISTVKARLLALELESELQAWLVQGKLPRSIDALQALLSIDQEARIGFARRAVNDPAFTAANLVSACKAYARVQKRAAEAPISPLNGHSCAPNGKSNSPIGLLPAGIPINQINPTIVYHETPELALCPGCAGAIHELMENCCDDCLKDGASSKCLQCGGFLEFANRLMQAVETTVVDNSHRQLNGVET